MKPVSGFTIKMMAAEIGLDPNTIKQRLFVAKEHPITTGALYSKKAFEKIKAVHKGRPRKKPILQKDGN